MADTHEKKRSLILDTAQQQFARRGFPKVTMEEIAAELGISKACLYYYFTTKEDIFREVVMREQDEFSTIAARILAKKLSADQRFTEYVRQRIRFFNRFVNLRTLASSTFGVLHPLMSELFRDFSDRELGLLTPIIRQGMRDGTFVSGRPEKTAALVLHLFQGLRFRFIRQQKMRRNNPKDVDDYEKECLLLAQVLLQGLVRRPARKQPQR
jgi:TetR/AcrR family transcriptional regulator